MPEMQVLDQNTSTDLAPPTLWGLPPVQLHDSFWAAAGVQVVRRDEELDIDQNAGLYLLCDSNMLVLFELPRISHAFSSGRTKAIIFRVADRFDEGYREIAVTTDNERSVRFERVYRNSAPRISRLILTTDPKIATEWCTTAEARSSWRLMFELISPVSRTVSTEDGRIFDLESEREVMDFVRELLTRWKSPNSVIDRVREIRSGVWVDHDAVIADNARLVGPLWVGSGREIDSRTTAAGPAVMWDAPDARPSTNGFSIARLNGAMVRGSSPRRSRCCPKTYFGKRTLDIMISLVALAITLPFYPLIMLVIWLDDRRPFFFAHQRETVGGTDFPCIKFRTMRRDAEKLAEKFAAQNQADGPQVNIKDDPRLLRVGSFLRKANIDELPQFFNVLLGHMSVVGPRPSPFKENQFCPPWREGRLSVRPGITGLWQVCRTREPGIDFQEWVRYDLEYVEKMSLKLDLWILCRTVVTIIRPILQKLKSKSKRAAADSDEQTPRNPES